MFVKTVPSYSLTHRHKADKLQGGPWMADAVLLGLVQYVYTLKRQASSAILRPKLFAQVWDTPC